MSTTRHAMKSLLKLLTGIDEMPSDTIQMRKVLVLLVLFSHMVSSFFFVLTTAFVFGINYGFSKFMAFLIQSVSSAMFFAWLRRQDNISPREIERIAELVSMACSLYWPMQYVLLGFNFCIPMVGLFISMVVVYMRLRSIITYLIVAVNVVLFAICEVLKSIKQTHIVLPLIPHILIDEYPLWLLIATNLSNYIVPTTLTLGLFMYVTSVQQIHTQVEMASHRSQVIEEKARRFRAEYELQQVVSLPGRKIQERSEDSLALSNSDFSGFFDAESNRQKLQAVKSQTDVFTGDEKATQVSWPLSLQSSSSVLPLPGEVPGEPVSRNTEFVCQRFIPADNQTDVGAEDKATGGSCSKALLPCCSAGMQTERPLLVEKETSPLVAWATYGFECQRCAKPPLMPSVAAAGSPAFNGIHRNPRPCSRSASPGRTETKDRSSRSSSRSLSSPRRPSSSSSSNSHTVEIHHDLSQTMDDFGVYSCDEDVHGDSSESDRASSKNNYKTTPLRSIIFGLQMLMDGIHVPRLRKKRCCTWHSHAACLEEGLSHILSEPCQPTWTNVIGDSEHVWQCSACFFLNDESDDFCCANCQTLKLSRT
eukprot:gnl/MRDRNA2_/MRDRNA2_171195_c0_seq1.p1 gnl/MRDRNA2_/MRDRNA2_171195_c0~~gnl/MRDRNA2_/MRDRNA2_171195_c0_seq1.p1  ORF type:complete len:592 (+),score=77.41 gnl/MRDRNA2_/MRDRNA2_171195_c0_seq1:102-1877(+)